MPPVNNNSLENFLKTHLEESKKKTLPVNSEVLSEEKKSDDKDHDEDDKKDHKKKKSEKDDDSDDDKKGQDEKTERERDTAFRQKLHSKFKKKKVDEATEAANSLKTHTSADAKNDDAKSISTAKVNKMKSDAAASSKDKDVSDPKAMSTSKVEAMKKFLEMVNEMEGVDMIAFFDKVQAQFGHWGDGVDDNSEKNKDSIKAKPSAAEGKSGATFKAPMPKLKVREDVEAMFAGENLSEEFIDKAETLFEAAISARIIVEIARLEEEFEEVYTDALKESVDEVVEKVDTYLDYVAKNWMEENAVAIESSLRNEIMSEAIEGLRTWFNDYNIDIPESKVDVVESLSKKVADLEARLDEQITENEELASRVIDEAREDIIEDVVSTLTLSQQEKFLKLSEGIDFDGDVEKFEKKLNIIKENYFKTPAKSTNILEEEFNGDEEEEEKAIDPQMKNFVDIISRTAKI